MPTNLYGPGDNYDLQNSHVLPALIRKMHEAKERGENGVVVWGTGTPRREFLHSDDMAEACLWLISLPEAEFSKAISGFPPLINIGCGTDLTIRELAETVAGVVGFRGALKFDTLKPDGTPRKLLDVRQLNSLGWRPRVRLESGIRSVYAEFCKGRPGTQDGMA
jgi:GDP-L-fucose synthase